VSGTRERYSVDDLSGQLRSTVVGSITDLFAESQVPFLDMASQQDELAAQLKGKVGEGFAKLGLELDGFVSRTCRSRRTCRRSSTSASG